MEVMDAPTAGSAHQVDAIEQRGEFQAPRRGAPSSVPGGGILAFKALGETQKATRALVQLLEAVKAACSMALGRAMAESSGPGRALWMANACPVRCLVTVRGHLLLALLTPLT